MRLYEFFARRNWPRSYTGKILLVSFIGVHVPMFGAVTYILLGDPAPFSQQIGILIAMLIATLVGTAGTMFVMNALLAPVEAAARAADGYLRERKTPRLPTRYTDSAGVLMASVQECVTRLDSAMAATEMQLADLEFDHATKFKMLAGMRHDFRTPLTHILGFAKLMKSEAIGPLGNKAYHSYLDKIGKSGRELLETLQSVLDLSDSVTYRQMKDDSEIFDLAVLAEDAVALEHLQAETRDVKVFLEAVEEIEVCTVKNVAKNILDGVLNAAISRTPAGNKVRCEVYREQGAVVICAESEGGKLFLEDVPANNCRFLGSLGSSAGNQTEVIETSTPLTIQFAMIATLAKAIGAILALESTEAGGFKILVTLPSPEMKLTSIAAE